MNSELLEQPYRDGGQSMTVDVTLDKLLLRVEQTRLDQDLARLHERLPCCSRVT